MDSYHHGNGVYMLQNFACAGGEGSNPFMVDFRQQMKNLRTQPSKELLGTRNLNTAICAWPTNACICLHFKLLLKEVRK